MTWSMKITQHGIPKPFLAVYAEVQSETNTATDGGNPGENDQF